jgi:hypothetical protein
MYLLDLDKIQLGDIILTRSEDRSSIFIQQHGNCRFSHAMLYAGESSYIEADGLGVHSMNARRKLFDASDDAVALRHKAKDENDAVEKAVNFARELIGTEYSGSEARQSMRDPQIKVIKQNRQYCSRLVAMAYQGTHLSVVENPEYCTIKDLLDSEYFEHIESILKDASQMEIDYANQKNTIIDKQLDNTNFILEQARNITFKDIQDLSQLTEFMRDNPEFDASISDVVKQSGYLDNWKIEMDKNPDYYDFNLFQVKCPFEQWKDVGTQFLAMANANLKRFEPMQVLYNELSRDFSLEYFEIFRELYINLVETASRMKAVGQTAITQSGR